MRILTLLSWTAIVLGAVGIVAGKTFHVLQSLHLGVFLIGAGFALGGLESLVTRRMSLISSSDTGEHYAGAPAVIWGLMALLVGAAAIDAAYLMQAGLWRTTVGQLIRHPGPAFCATGLLLAGAGALLMVRPDRCSGRWRTFLVRYPRALVGAAILLTGVLAIAIGAGEWINPRGLDHYVRPPHDAYLRAVRETWMTAMRGLLYSYWR